MKKVLLATTVLAMSATVAAAEVTLTGNARMGVVYTGAAANNKLQFSSRVRASIAMSGETDGGLAFGGSFDVHNAGAAANGSSGSVFISGAFGKLSMGNVVGAAEEVVGDLPEIGFTDIAANDTDFLTGDGAIYGTANNPGALYTYSTGALTFALGMNDGFDAAAVPARVSATSVGVKYSMDAYSFALGYEIAKPNGLASAKLLSAAATGTFGNVTAKVIVTDGAGAIAGYSSAGLGLTYKADALTLNAMAHRVKVGGLSMTAYGVGASYDLGGGASIAGGISDNNAAGNNTVADLGLKFTF